MRIRSFRGLRPPVGLAPQVAAVPYDVVDTQEARKLAEGEPLSLLRVSRPEMHFPDGTDPYSDAVYAKAKEEFARLQDQGALVREPAPSIYIYQQKMGDHVQRGVMAVCHVDDYEKDVIRKHEKTRKDKEDDRTRITHELSANLGPVFLCHRDDRDVEQATSEACQGSPLVEFTAPDGVVHTLWKTEQSQALVDAFAKVPVSYVADGHHRAASAARVGRMRRELQPQGTGEEDFNWFLAVLFPAGQLQILPYNRVVVDLCGLDPEAFLAKLREVCHVLPAETACADATGVCAMFLEGRWWKVILPLAASDDPAARLDVSVLQDRVLKPLLGIEDPRTSKRIDFVGGIRGTQELESRVQEGRGAVAFAMYPVTVAQLMDIADAGQIMPPKSTWFEPKLRSGMVIHTLGS